MSRKLFIFLVLGAIALIVAYRLLDWNFNWALFVSSLWTLHPGWLVASLVATALTYVTRALRWRVLLGPIPGARFASLLSATVIGFSAINLFGRLGELARPLLLSRRERVPLTTSIATVIVERVFDLVMLVVVFAWALLTVRVSPGSETTLGSIQRSAWPIAAGAAGIIVFLFIFRSNSDWIIRRVPFERVGSLMASFAGGLAALATWRTLALAMFHSLLVWIAIGLQFWCMLRGMNFALSLEAAMLVMVASAIGSIAQLPGIGGGFQAGFIFCLVTFFGVTAERAVAASLVAWTLSYIPTWIAGIFYMFIEGISLSDLKSTMSRNPQSETL